MFWSRWMELPGPRRIWAASTVITALGLVFAFGLPSFIEFEGPDAKNMVLVLRVLGGVFVALGLPVLLAMLASLAVADSERRDRIYWWINVMGGLMGALAFAVPAMLVFPAFLVAYLTRPNSFVPADTDVVKSLGLSCLFSTVGLITLVAVFLTARRTIETRRSLGAGPNGGVSTRRHGRFGARG